MTKSVTSTIGFSWMAERFSCQWQEHKPSEMLDNSLDTDQAFLLREVHSYELVKTQMRRNPAGWLEVEAPKAKLLEDIGKIHDALKDDRLSEARVFIEKIANSVTPHALQHSPSTAKPSSFRAWADTCWIIGEYLHAVSILNSEGVSSAVKYVREQIVIEANGGLAWSNTQNTTVLTNANARLRSYPPVCWNNNEYLQICRSRTANHFRNAVFASLINVFNQDTKFSLQDVYSAIQQGYKPNLPDEQTMRMWADSGIRGMAAYCLAVSIQRADRIVLCEGCGLPLVKTRRNRATHGASCRKQKQRNAAVVERAV